jgi:hypothetical protein
VPSPLHPVSFPRQPAGRPRVRSGPPGPQPRPPPRSTLAAGSSEHRTAGRRLGCQGNGRTPGSRPHRLRP